MADKNVHPITKKNLEAHLKKVDEHMTSINRGVIDRENLFEVAKGIGSGNKDLMSKEVTDTIEALRTGFSLFYEMYSVLEDKTKEIDIEEPEKRAFLNSYSMFAATSYIDYKLDLITGDKEPFPYDEKDLPKMNFDLTKDDALNGFLVRYYGLVNYGKRHEILQEGADMARGSINFFEAAKKQCLGNKKSFNPKLVELVNNSCFRVADEFTINGFEASHVKKISSEAVFVPMMPNQVAGNVLAKKEMLRDMDRIALFDLVTGKNPVLDVGGLSWSVLYDGLPGTGKSSLFRMGFTRLKQRCDQASEFWKSKNLGVLKWAQINIDQGIKDEYYGKTGKNLLEKLEPTKRADGIYIITTDDIDLLVSGDRNSSSGGSDRDILNILMQYADGINTLIRGNVQWWAATNDATSMDPALRQRFISRYAVDGPEEWSDFADIFYDKLKGWIDTKIIDLPNGKEYSPYQSRKGQTGYDQKSEKSKGVTLRDIGELCKSKKDLNPRFTGRAVHAVTEAIKTRINDYEIPAEWYEKPEIFFSQDYNKKVDMLKELCKKVTGDMIMQEIERYASSETRYAQEKFERDVQNYVHGLKVQDESIKRYKDKK
jgi:hypothetical protein